MNPVTFSLSVSNAIQFSPCQTVLVRSRSAGGGRKDLLACLQRTRHPPAILCCAGLGPTQLPDRGADWDVHHCLPSCSVMSLVWGLPQLSSLRVLELMKWSPQSLVFFLLARTLWSCRLELEISAHCSVHLCAHWITVRKAFSSLLPFSAVHQVPLLYLSGSLCETAWLLLWAERASDEHSTWIWSL